LTNIRAILNWKQALIKAGTAAALTFFGGLQAVILTTGGTQTIINNPATILIPVGISTGLVFFSTLQQIDQAPSGSSIKVSA
jgi:hypothetical protein